MNKEEELIIKEFDKQQLELLLNDLKDIDKFTGFKNGAFKYELGKYQADLLVNRITKYKEVIDEAIEYIETHKRKDEFLELNEWGTRDLLDILKEVE